MSFRLANLARLFGAVSLTSAALLTTHVPSASAQGCPDVQVVFARGTAEPPGFGGVGQAFVDSFREQAGARSVDTYPVNYPASSDFGDRIAFARTVVDGIRDAAGKIESTATNCPNTKIVLGGFSQGAALAGYVTAAEVPASIPAEYREFIPNPMPADVAKHVAAVVLIGLPSPQFLTDIGAPQVIIGPSYEPKTLRMCADDDTICNGAPLGGPSLAHSLYGVNGMAAQAAGYAVGKL